MIAWVIVMINDSNNNWWEFINMANHEWYNFNVLSYCLQVYIYQRAWVLQHTMSWTLLLAILVRTCPHNQWQLHILCKIVSWMIGRLTLENQHSAVGSLFLSRWYSTLILWVRPLGWILLCPVMNFSIIGSVTLFPVQQIQNINFNVV